MASVDLGRTVAVSWEGGRGMLWNVFKENVDTKSETRYAG